MKYRMEDLERLAALEEAEKSLINLLGEFMTNYPRNQEELELLFVEFYTLLELLPKEHELNQKLPKLLLSGIVLNAKKGRSNYSNFHTLLNPASN